MNPVERSDLRRILVFPAGTEIALEILGALRWCRGVSVIGAGDASSNPGRFAFPAYFEIPNVSDPGWLPALVELVQDQHVDYIFPAHDEALLALANAVDNVPCPVVGSPPETSILTRSKSKTYERLRGSVKVPQVYGEVQAVSQFPVFVKPDAGFGARHSRVAKNSDDLILAVEEAGEAVICEYLPGEEYTVDCFSSRRNGLLFAGARQRIRTRNGIAVHSRAVCLPEVPEIAKAIMTRIELNGAWFFQLKRDSRGELTLLEVAPRIAGTMGLHRVMGINFPMLSILDLEGESLRVMPLDVTLEVDRALSSRFRHSMEFRALYVDLDDTLLFSGKVNADLVAVIFKAINEGKRVSLITRHAGQLQDTLMRHRLSELFDDVIHVAVGREKYEFIDPEGALFIDDSFVEREKVSLRLGIPTLDASMLDLIK